MPWHSKIAGLQMKDAVHGVQGENKQTRNKNVYVFKLHGKQEYHENTEDVKRTSSALSEIIRLNFGHLKKMFLCNPLGHYTAMDYICVICIFNHFFSFFLIIIFFTSQLQFPLFLSSPLPPTTPSSGKGRPSKYVSQPQHIKLQ